MFPNEGPRLCEGRVRDSTQNSLARSFQGTDRSIDMRNRAPSLEASSTTQLSCGHFQFVAGA